jgi:hypothetical protein
MGDRYYIQQKEHKPKRILKKDVIAEINENLSAGIVGLDKCTITTLTQLLEALNDKLVQ